MSGAEDAAELTVGPTSLGMVRISVTEAGRETVLDFDPEDAEEIAEELRAAAARARAAASARRSGGQGRG